MIKEKKEVDHLPMNKEAILLIKKKEKIELKIKNMIEKEMVQKEEGIEKEKKQAKRGKQKEHLFQERDQEGIKAEPVIKRKFLLMKFLIL